MARESCGCGTSSECLRGMRRVGWKYVRVEILRADCSSTQQEEQGGQTCKGRHALVMQENTRCRQRRQWTGVLNDVGERMSGQMGGPRPPAHMR